MSVFVLFHLLFLTKILLEIKIFSVKALNINDFSFWFYSWCQSLLLNIVIKVAKIFIFNCLMKPFWIFKWSPLHSWWMISKLVIFAFWKFSSILSINSLYFKSSIYGIRSCSYHLYLVFPFVGVYLFISFFSIVLFKK